tara:strand:+ start:68 stop:364 length:297 start_codon:yes stop_codon:yes gene_type:complete
MKLLRTSNYENKEVINFLKTQFSIIESAKSSFTTSQFLEMDRLIISFDGESYKLSFEGLNHHSLNFKSNVTENTDNRVKAIKTVLYRLGIITKIELEK